MFSLCMLLGNTFVNMGEVDMLTLRKMKKNGMSIFEAQYLLMAIWKMNGQDVKDFVKLNSKKLREYWDSIVIKDNFFKKFWRNHVCN